MGATGDAGHFERLAGLLADEFTVVTYDRRGNGRSPRPVGWQTTSPEDQADDAATLLGALDLRPAAVFGSGSGATFALCLLVRHPEAVCGASLHEPVIAQAPAPAGPHTSATRPRDALERFWRTVAGDANWTRLDAGLRARMVDSAETFFDIEWSTFEHYRPSAEALAAVTAPVQLLVSEHGRASLHAPAGQLAERVGVPLTRVPGTHTPYWDHPRELADALRPFLVPPVPGAEALGRSGVSAILGSAGGQSQRSYGSISTGLDGRSALHGTRGPRRQRREHSEAFGLPWRTSRSRSSCARHAPRISRDGGPRARPFRLVVPRYLHGRGCGQRENVSFHISL
jgi:pimeloyl-ACP methyl ester carboxylesterase